MGIVRVDPLDQFARVRVIRDDRTGLDRVVAHVESQLGLSFVGILPMAIEAVLRQDRPDVAIEVESGRRGVRRAGQSQKHMHILANKKPSSNRGRRSILRLWFAFFIVKSSCQDAPSPHRIGFVVGLERNLLNVKQIIH